MELTDRHFQKISRLVYDICGINLKEGKEALVRSRLLKRIRALGFDSFEDYVALLEGEGGGGEIPALVDVITTNKTGFFREPDHFYFIRDEILPVIRSQKMRFWSAACSSGEEPYSLAVVLKESIKDLHNKDVRILATDISSRMIEHARRGLYSRESMRDVPPQYVSKYFLKSGPVDALYFTPSDDIRSLVTFSRLNLMENWPMKGPFDVILCRNVMIYFDRPTQERLVNRFWDILRPGGYLFVGHSEGLTGVSHKFRHVRPAIYRR